MNASAMQLPWTMKNVPHAVLDILRGCNVRCRDCYNLQPDYIKPLAEIETQLDELLRLRQLHSVSVVGGEITLHPDLAEIVRRVRRRDLFVELFTNGVALNGQSLTELKQAGANLIFLHIEADQRRTDLPINSTADDLRKLRESKVALVAAHGIEVGLAVTIYPDKLAELEEAVRFALESPNVSYLLVTLWRDVGRMPPVHGDLEKGMFTESDEFRRLNIKDQFSHRDVSQLLESKFALAPFGYIGSNVDANEPRWLSFLTAAVNKENKLIFRRSLKPTWVEGAFLDIARRFTGRYPFYQPQRAGRFALHLLLNGLAGGGFVNNLKLLAKSCRPGTRLGLKRLLFQWPATFDAQGRVIHCQCCPDAVLKGGHLVPLCISDLIGNSVSAGEKPREILRQL